MLILPLLASYLTLDLPLAVAWHPFHPLLVSGGSEGAILHWDLSSPDPIETSAPTIGPRATLSQAHDSNVWSLAYHPLGHLLASASNDHTTRFWSRERPGDPTSVFSGGGEKPPDVVDATGQDDEDEMMVPGFGGNAGWFGSQGGRATPLDNGNEDDFQIPGLSTAPAPPMRAPPPPDRDLDDRRIPPPRIPREDGYSGGRGRYEREEWPRDNREEEYYRGGGGGGDHYRAPPEDGYDRHSGGDDFYRGGRGDGGNRRGGWGARRSGRY